MRITKWGEFGVLCSLYLASKYSEERCIGAAEIADMQGIDVQYAQQILQRLRRGNIIESVRGPHGGYKLTREPEQISLQQVLEATEGATFEVICEAHPLYGEECSTNTACGLREVWEDVRLAIDKVLTTRTLATVLENHAFVSRSRRSEDHAVSSDSQTKLTVSEQASSLTVLGGE